MVARATRVIGLLLSAAHAHFSMNGRETAAEAARVLTSPCDRRRMIPSTNWWEGCVAGVGLKTDVGYTWLFCLGRTAQMGTQKSVT